MKVSCVKLNNFNFSKIYNNQVKNLLTNKFQTNYADIISNQNKAFVNKSYLTKIDKTSEACKFFGVDSIKNVFKQIKNQCLLTNLKTKNLGISKSFMHGTCIDFSDKKSLEKAKNNIWNGYIREKNGISNAFSGIEELKKNGSARTTVYGKLYGKMGKKGSHTIGLVYDEKSNNLYILDSLGEKLPTSKIHHKILKDLFTQTDLSSSNKPFNNVIISSKKQQGYNQYCCNNWTFANIEAVNDALKKGLRISNSDELNKILPNDINKVLSEQKDFVEKNISKSTIHH